MKLFGFLNMFLTTPKKSRKSRKSRRSRRSHHSRKFNYYAQPNTHKYRHNTKKHRKILRGG